MSKEKGGRGADPKIAERRATLARQKRRRRLRWVRAVAIVAVIGLVAFLTLRSRPLTVQSVSITGLDRVPEESVIAAADLEGRPLVTVDSAGAASRIKAIPQVLAVQVRTDYLRRAVAVDIVERRPAAIAGRPGSYLVVDVEGMAMEATPTPASGFIYLTGEVTPRTVGEVEPRAGEAVAAGVEISKWSLVAVKAAGVGSRGIFLVMADGALVYLGSADQMEEKGRRLRALQAKGEAERWRGLVYELSSPDAPSVQKSEG